MKRERHVGPQKEIVDTLRLEDGRVLRVVGMPRAKGKVAHEMDVTIAWLRASGWDDEPPTQNQRIPPRSPRP